MTDTSEILEFISVCERRAGELILRARNIIAENKTGSRNVVTEYDIKVQTMLREAIKNQIPDAGFFCEETADTDTLAKGRCFIIDPIDGTMNFVKGFNHSCISIAYILDGEVLAAAVYNPFSDELFTAEKGRGAYLNGKRIHCGEAPLSDSIVCVGTSPYRPELSDRTFSTVQLLFESSLDVRRQGSAELDLCYVAAGRAGLYWELDVSLWDYAAGYLIVNEAGGVCLDGNGNPLPFTESKTSITAGTPKAFEDYIKLIG